MTGCEIVNTGRGIILMPISDSLKEESCRLSARISGPSKSCDRLCRFSQGKL